MREDSADAFAWETSTTVYAEGAMSARKVDFDNGDTTYTIYEDRARVALLKVDGDDSHSWAVQVTEFSNAGKSRTIYDELSDLPATFDYLFAADTFAIERVRPCVVSQIAQGLLRQSL